MKYSNIILILAIGIFGLTGAITVDLVSAAIIVATIQSWLATHSPYLWGFVAFETQKVLKEDWVFDFKHFTLRVVIMLAMLNFLMSIVESFNLQEGMSDVVLFLLGGSTLLILDIIKNILLKTFTEENIAKVLPSKLWDFIQKPVKVETTPVVVEKKEEIFTELEEELKKI